MADVEPRQQWHFADLTLDRGQRSRMRSGQFLEVAKLTFDFLTVQRRTGTERRRSRANPRVRFRVSTESLDGNTHLWELEGTGVTRIDRGGVPHDLMHVGDAISFAANPSRTNAERSD